MTILLANCFIVRYLTLQPTLDVVTTTTSTNSTTFATTLKTGSMQLAEFRASPQAGIGNHLSTSTHSTRFGLRRGPLNQPVDGCGMRRNQLSVRMSSTLATSSLRCHLPVASAVVVHHPPTSADAGITIDLVHPADSELTDEAPDREFRFAASRANRSSANANHLRKQELLG